MTARHHGNPYSHKRAFTLLEVLLALSIMSVLAVALFSSLHAAFKSKRVAEASLDTIREGEAAIELIRADLEAALPPRGVLAGTFIGRDWMSGEGLDDDDISFFSTAPAPPTVVTPAEIKKIELIVLTLEGTGERVLARRVTSNLLANLRPQPDDEVLCRNVAGLNFSYFDGLLWWSDWDSTLESDSLPAAIEVTLELDPPQSRRNAGDLRRLRFTRVVHISCKGEGDSFERDPFATETSTQDQAPGAGTEGPE